MRYFFWAYGDERGQHTDASTYKQRAAIRSHVLSHHMRWSGNVSRELPRSLHRRRYIQHGGEEQRGPASKGRCNQREEGEKSHRNCFFEVGAGDGDDVARRRAESGLGLRAPPRSSSRLAATCRQEHHHERQRYIQRMRQRHRAGSVSGRP